MRKPNSDLVDVQGMICTTAFNTTTAYVIGDIVTYEHGLYEFKVNHDAGVWNSSEVDEINIITILGDIDAVLEAVL